MKKKKICSLISLFAAAAVAVCACGSGQESETQGTPENMEEVSISTESGAAEPARIIAECGAEEAELLGNARLASMAGGGEKAEITYITGLEQDGDGCLFRVDIPESGFFDLNFFSASEGGYKENFVSADGERIGTIVTEEAEFADSFVKRVYLEAGVHEIEVIKNWGWIRIDALTVAEAEALDESIYKVEAGLANPNASEEAKRLYSYLCDIYGEKFLSGQYCDTGPFGKEMQVVKKTTGKTPAVLGLDFIEYTPSRAENGSVGHSTEYAVNFWESGGIVTFCWHWNAPSKYLTGQWYRGFYADSTNIDLEKIMNGEDEEGYELLMKDIDAIAKQLLILKDAHVPVLWRPLHEAGGGWFWWGAGGADAYKKLYVLLYDRLTNEYGLNNLIWIWNGQDAGWYPGDEYVDIIGEDIYPGERVYTSQADSYLNAAMNYSGETKMVYLSENGCVFDPALARRDGAMWGMWCTWQGEFVAKDTAIFTLSEQYTEASMLKKAYEDEDVITLEELPDLTVYEIRENLK